MKGTPINLHYPLLQCLGRSQPVCKRKNTIIKQKKHLSWQIHAFHVRHVRVGKKHLHQFGIVNTPLKTNEYSLKNQWLVQMIHFLLSPGPSLFGGRSIRKFAGGGGIARGPTFKQMMDELNAFAFDPPIATKKKARWEVRKHAPYTAYTV